MGTKCEPGTTSRASLPDFSSDEDSDNEVPEPSEVCVRDTTSTNFFQKKRRESYYGVHSDKESLLEELLALKDAFEDQKFHFKAHKEHRNAMEEENSRLEKKIEYLETSGLEAALTGTQTKLKSKLKVCKARIMNLENTCCTNAAEVRRLYKDTQFMKTQNTQIQEIPSEVINHVVQEVAVERESFALEVRRLQRCVFHLGNLYKKVSEDNKEAFRLKVKITMLTAKNPELTTSISLHRKSLEDMATKSVEWTAKGAAAKKACARDHERFKTLQEESKSIMDVLFKEKLAKAELTTDINTVSHQVREAERDTREKERKAALGVE